MTPIDEGKRIPKRRTSVHTSKKSNINSQRSIRTDKEDYDSEEAMQVNLEIDEKFKV